MQSLHPRTEGSAGEKEAISFISDRLSLLKVPMTVLDFSKSSTGHSFSRIIETTIKGRSNDQLIIAIPLNHAAGAAKENDGSFGIALGLALLGEYTERQPEISLSVVFLGGEFPEGEETRLGTAHFLRSSFPTQRQAVLYLDAHDLSDHILIQPGGKGIISPRWLVDKTAQAFSNPGVSYALQGNRMQVFRTGLAAGTPIEAYLRAGIPSICIQTQSTAPSEEAAHTVFSCLTLFIDSFQGKIPAEWDLHYIFFSLPFFGIFIPETVYIVFLLLLVVVLVFFASLKMKQLKKYVRTVIRNIWNIPFFLVASFLILLGSSLILEGFLSVKNIPTLWTSIPALFLILKITFFFAASTFFFRLFRRLPFSKNGSFYTASALFFILISIFIIAFINISFTYYFLWALVFIVLFSIARSRRLKVLFFLLSPLSIIAAVIDIFSIPELGLCEIILFNQFIGNLLTAVILLPFVLLLIRIRLFFPYRRTSFLMSKSFLFMLFFVLAAVACTVFLFVYQPYNAANPKPVRAEHIIDFDKKTHRLVLSSPAALGEFVVADKYGLHPLITRAREYFIPLTDIKDYVSVQISSTRFADRKNIDITLAFTGEPYKIRATLVSDEDFKLYDSNYPVNSRFEKGYGISIGTNPPQNLLLQLTLNTGRTYTLSLELLYKDPPIDIDIYGDDIIVEKRLQFKKDVLLAL